ncbi:MAG: hypothetical protein LBD93_01825 [Treponema sp.]|jgi:hypothetical protein|nr:hypothetical protein [Treponema sp.]
MVKLHILSPIQKYKTTKSPPNKAALDRRLSARCSENVLTKKIHPISGFVKSIFIFFNKKYRRRLFRVSLYITRNHKIKMTETRQIYLEQKEFSAEEAAEPRPYSKNNENVLKRTDPLNVILSRPLPVSPFSVFA